jgi:hypothetical protein
MNEKNQNSVFNKMNMSNFVLQNVHKTSVLVPSTSLRNGNSSRNAGSNFVLVFGITLSKIFGTTDSRTH